MGSYIKKSILILIALMLVLSSCSAPYAVQEPNIKANSLADGQNVTESKKPQETSELPSPKTDDPFTAEALDPLDVRALVGKDNRITSVCETLGLTYNEEWTGYLKEMNQPYEVYSKALKTHLPGAMKKDNLSYITCAAKALANGRVAEIEYGYKLSSVLSAEEMADLYFEVVQALGKMINNTDNSQHYSTGKEQGNTFDRNTLVELIQKQDGYSTYETVFSQMAGGNTLRLMLLEGGEDYASLHMFWNFGVPETAEE